MMNSMIKSNYGKTLDDQIGTQDGLASGNLQVDDNSAIDGGNSIIQNQQH